MLCTELESAREREDGRERPRERTGERQREREREEERERERERAASSAERESAADRTARAHGEHAACGGSRSIILRNERGKVARARRDTAKAVRRAPAPPARTPREPWHARACVHRAPTSPAPSFPRFFRPGQTSMWPRRVASATSDSRVPHIFCTTVTRTRHGGLQVVLGTGVRGLDNGRGVVVDGVLARVLGNVRQHRLLLLPQQRRGGVVNVRKQLPKWGFEPLLRA